MLLPAVRRGAYTPDAVRVRCITNAGDARGYGLGAGGTMRITFTEQAVELARERDGVVALDFIPTLG